MSKLANMSERKVGISSDVQKEVYAERKDKSHCCILWQTERGIDIQPLCNLYSVSKDDNGDGNSDMHDDHD